MRIVWVLEDLAEILHFGSHQETGGRLSHVVDDSLCRRVCTVG